MNAERFLTAVLAVNNYDARHQEMLGCQSAERDALVAEMWAEMRSTYSRTRNSGYVRSGRGRS